MGYRSQIAINIYGPKIDLVKAFYDTEYELLTPDAQDDVKHFYKESMWQERETGLEFFFQHDNLKWYPDYPSVDFIEDVVGFAREIGLNVEYVRIGEDNDDCVADYDGDLVEYRLEVDRSISVNF